MRREMLRQKWEEEERAAMNQPLHYANVQYDGRIFHPFPVGLVYWLLIAN